MTSAWIKHAFLAFLCLGIPAMITITIGGMRRTRESRSSARATAPFALAISTLALYAGSFPNIIWEWSVGYMVGWPFVGMLLCLIGIFLSCFAVASLRMLLVTAHSCLFALSYCSLVRPN